jgi:hypothetical protein
MRVGYGYAFKRGQSYGDSGRNDCMATSTAQSGHEEIYNFLTRDMDWSAEQCDSKMYYTKHDATALQFHHFTHFDSFLVPISKHANLPRSVLKYRNVYNIKLHDGHSVIY